jgi:hypothetical protein
MSNAFTNFLSGVAGGFLGTTGDLKDYQHADRLYVRNTYARAPKHGFLYFVSLNVNPAAIGDAKWSQQGGVRDVGLLVKKIDLPKFNITTETINQYNRKTVVQSKLTYQPVSMEFHDDNSDITNNLWINYYRYYFSDSNYTGQSGQTTPTAPANNRKSASLLTGIAKSVVNTLRGGNNPRSLGAASGVSGVPTAFGDTKYGTTDYSYGLSNSQSIPFFKSIDIYVMHQQKFTQITLVNPLVTDWAHDNLDQNEGGKILQNKMTIAYEDVLYNSGKITKGSESSKFTAVYYDTSPSPLSVGGNGTNTLFGAGGVLAGASSVFGNLTGDNPNYLAAVIQGANVVKNAKNLNLKTEGYSMVSGVLGSIQATGNQPGGTLGAARQGLNQSGIGQLGNVMINSFAGQNSSVNNTIQSKPSNITGA